MRFDDDDIVACLLAPVAYSPRPHSIYAALQHGLVPRIFLRQAWDIIANLEQRSPSRPSWAIPDRSWKYNSDPSWDNVVKAAEEDR